MNLKIKFPFIVCAGDYHHFENVQCFLQEFSKKKIKFKELESDGDYKAVFYIGLRPKKTSGLEVKHFS